MFGKNIQPRKVSMPGKKVTIGGNIYNSQKEAKVAVVARLNKMKTKYKLEYGKKIREKVTIGEDFDFLLDLFNNHPYAEEMLEGELPDAFVVELNQMNKGSIHLIYNTTGCKEDSFSWNACITGKTQSKEMAIESALRHAIVPDIHKFKVRNRKCAVCQTGGIMEIDHCGDMEFRHISAGFKKENDLSDVELCKTNLYTSSFVDDAISERFRKYHNKYAKLQALCVKCHKTKTSSRSD